MKQLIPAAVLALAFLAITGAAEAAPPSYWTPAQAQAALKRPTTLAIGVGERDGDTTLAEIDLLVDQLQQQAAYMIGDEK